LRYKIREARKAVIAPGKNDLAHVDQLRALDTPPTR
jgi:hypothetical protein